MRMTEIYSPYPLSWLADYLNSLIARCRCLAFVKMGAPLDPEIYQDKGLMILRVFSYCTSEDYVGNTREGYVRIYKDYIGIQYKEGIVLRSSLPRPCIRDCCVHKP